MVGVDRRTVIESVDFDDDADAVVVRVRRRRPEKVGAGVAGGWRRAMTGGKDVGGGGPWTSVSCAASWSPTRPG
jgi:hypothetical protein